MKLKDAPKKLQDASALIGAVIAIGAALIGAGKWIVSEINASVNDRIDALEQKIDDNQNEDKLAITRLELLTLIQTEPENVVEIERLAKVYFVTLKGDFYMTGVYSKYAKEYGADTSFVVYH